jgi:hypothetical protein
MLSNRSPWYAAVVRRDLTGRIGAKGDAAGKATCRGPGGPLSRHALSPVSSADEAGP